VGVRGLTQGGFAVVARQLRYHPASGVEDIVIRLRAEVAAKCAPADPIGF
jgi:transitional endoplasmic reticulum ATPase